MANLIRRNPGTTSELANVWEPLRTVRELMNWDPFAEMLPSTETGMTTFMPRFEVKETKDAYQFKADLPGVEEKDLEITFTGNRLTVSGKREAEKTDEGETFYAYERSYGTFSRSFTLPEGADVDHAAAELSNGVLAISLPKLPEHQPKKISIRSVGEKVKAALGGKEKGIA